MKKCCYCGEVKSKANFSAKSARCRPCQAIYKAEWRRKHPDAQRGYDTKRKRQVREYVLECKGLPCIDCDRSYPYYVMEFDHVRGKKLFAIGSAMSAHPRTLSAVKKEIEKCDLVCANCHRERTYQRGYGN